MYEYKVSMYTGLKGSENRGLYRVLIISSDDLLTNEEIRLQALKEIGTYPRTHHFEIELLKPIGSCNGNDTEEIINDLDSLMMSISVRKTEIIDKYKHNDLGKPNLNDLDWCFEQLYYLKKQYDEK